MATSEQPEVKISSEEFLDEEDGKKLDKLKKKGFFRKSLKSSSKTKEKDAKKGTKGTDKSALDEGFKEKKSEKAEGMLTLSP